MRTWTGTMLFPLVVQDKPLTTRRSEADRLVEAVAQSGVKFLLWNRNYLPALVQALDSRRLSGAGVDVTDPEPLPKGHALWKFENTIVTPHIAGRSDKDRDRMVGTIRENIKRFADGRPLINVVDKQKGY